MAQLVEHNLAKVGVAGSSPVVRSIAFPDRLGGPFSAKWPSGKAEACKAFTPGSNPGFASRQHPGAPAPVLFYICGHGSVGRAQPCQGWGRGFEPRCPLQTQQPDYQGSRAFSYPLHRLEPERERALSKRGAFVASWRGRQQAAEAGADPRSGCAESYTPHQLNLKPPATGASPLLKPCMDSNLGRRRLILIESCKISSRCRASTAATSSDDRSG